jgi:hypothetical protein
MTDKVNGNYRSGSFLSGQPQWWAFATVVPMGQTNVDTPVVDLPGYQTYATLGTWTNVTVTNGAGTAVTYSSLNTYLNAFYQQQNMNILVNTFAARGNPVQVGVTNFASQSVNGNPVVGNSAYWADANYINNIATPTSIFGTSTYNATANFTIVTISTEKNNEWEVNGYYNYGTGPDATTPDNTNVNGYNILSSNAIYGGLDGLLCYDNQSGQVLSGSTNSSAAATNSTFATTNTVAPYVNTFITSSTSLTNVMASINMMLPGGTI